MAQAQLQNAFDTLMIPQAQAYPLQELTSALQQNAIVSRPTQRKRATRAQFPNSRTSRTRLGATQTLSSSQSNVRRRNRTKTTTASRKKKNTNLAVNAVLRNNFPVSRVLISQCQNISNSNALLPSGSDNIISSNNFCPNEDINVASTNSLISNSVQTAPTHNTLIDNIANDLFSESNQLLVTNTPTNTSTSPSNGSAEPQVFATNLSQFLILFAHIFDVFFVPQLLLTFCSPEAPSISAMKIFLYRDFIFSDFIEAIQREQTVRLSSSSHPTPITIDQSFELFLASSRKLGFTFI